MEFHLRDSPDEIFCEGSRTEDGRSIRYAKWRIGESARPDGRDRRERPSGALESASAVSRARARKRAVSCSEHSGGRVTATAEAGRHERVAPTRGKGRPGPPVSDEGGVRRLSGAPMSRRAERPRGLAVATPTALRPRSGASRSEVAPGAGNGKKGPKLKIMVTRPCGASAGFCGREAGRNARGPAVRT